jgi:hypothetical protein
MQLVSHYQLQIMRTFKYLNQMAVSIVQQKLEVYIKVKEPVR